MVTREQVDGLLDRASSTSGWPGPPFDDETFGSRLLHREALLVARPLGHRLAGAGPADDGPRTWRASR